MAFEHDLMIIERRSAYLKVTMQIVITMLTIADS